MSVSVEQQHVIQRTLDWLDRLVIGLNLCPFAAPVRQAGSIRVAVCGVGSGAESTTTSSVEDESEIVASLLQELDRLQQAEAGEISTTLLVFPQALQQFDDYWQFAEQANELLVEVGLEGIIQLATFHPDYLFEGESEEDVSHYTNRSPYPMLHLIREQQLEQALAQYPDPEQIPLRNIDTLQRLGKQQLLALLAK